MPKMAFKHYITDSKKVIRKDNDQNPLKLSDIRFLRSSRTHRSKKRININLIILSFFIFKLLIFLLNFILQVEEKTMKKTLCNLICQKVIGLTYFQ